MKERLRVAVVALGALVLCGVGVALGQGGVWSLGVAPLAGGGAPTAATLAPLPPTPKLPDAAQVWRARRRLLRRTLARRRQRLQAHTRWLYRTYRRPLFAEAQSLDDLRRRLVQRRHLLHIVQTDVARLRTLQARVRRCSNRIAALKSKAPRSQDAASMPFTGGDVWQPTPGAQGTGTLRWSPAPPPAAAGATAVSPPLAQSGQASPVAATGGTEAALSPALGHAAVQPEADPLPMRPAMRPGALARPVIEAGAKVTAQGSGGGRMLRFVVRERTPVRAVAQGQVTQVQSGGPGARVVLAHDDGLRSVYEGVQQVEVRAGDRVGMGAQLGRIDAAHALRFRLQQRGRTVDAGVWLGL